jgi:hypothetical protein
MLGQRAAAAELFAGTFMLIVCPLAIVALVVFILFLLSMHKALQRVSPGNRLMEPGLVWLMFVPCLNIVWQFLIAIRVPDSLRNEFHSRGLPEEGDFGKGIGLMYCILGLVGGLPANVLSRQPETAVVGAGIALVVGVIQLALGITFWTKIVNARRQLEVMGEGYPGDPRRDLGDYDRPFRPGESQGPSEPPDTYRPDEPGRYQ